MEQKYVYITLADGMGTMRLNLDNCFPCGVNWLEKLYKKCILPDWENRERVLNEILHFCQDKLLVYSMKHPKDKRGLDRLRRNVETVHQFLVEVKG